MHRSTVFMLASALLLAQPALSAPGDARFQPASQTVAENAAFTLEIRVDSGSSRAAAYTFTLAFDPMELQVDTGAGGDQGIEPGADALGSNIVNVDNATGVATVTGFDVSGAGPGTDLHLLTVNFRAGGSPGAANLGLAVETFADELGQTIGTPSGQPATVNIGSGVATRHTLSVVRAGSGAGNVSSAPAGISCGATCSAAFDAGTSVTLQASPDGGSTFGGWSGDAGCGDGTVELDGDRTCIAVFELDAALPEGTARLQPTGMTVAAGAAFALELWVKAGASRIGAYTFDLAFDPGQIRMDPAGGGDQGVAPGGDALGSNIVNVDNVAGTATLTGFDVAGSGPGELLHLLTLNMTAGDVTGVASIELEVSALTDEVGQTIGTPTGIGSTVAIGERGETIFTSGFEALVGR